MKLRKQPLPKRKFRGQAHEIKAQIEKTTSDYDKEKLQERLAKLAAPQATLLVLPEGLSLNYWLRLRNPSRYWLFIPAEFDAAGGEDVMLADVRAHPPDFVALVDRPHREFGVGHFGADPRNGQRLMDFVRAEYDVVKQLGAVPFRDHGFGITILRRRAPGTAASPPQRASGSLAWSRRFDWKLAEQDMAEAIEAARSDR
jgi:hypothetical protein